MTSHTTKSLTQKTLDGLRDEVAQEEAKFLEHEPNLSADTVTTSRECIATVRQRLDEVQTIYDRNPSALSLGQMMETRAYHTEQLQQLNKNCIQKYRNTTTTTAAEAAPLGGTTL